MKSCTFFGHRDCPESVKPALRQTIVDLIENHEVGQFYVGNQGRFDRMVRGVLHELQGNYSINYDVVLAYWPVNGQQLDVDDHTLLPDGIETVHPRYAIAWRNRWLVDHCDWAVVYITHSFGGAAQFAMLAEKKNKQLINLAGK